MAFVRNILVAATLLVTGSAMAQGDGRSYKAVADKIIAVVGDKIILQSDVTNSIDDARRQGRTVPDSAFCMIMQQAIISKVLMLQAQKDSLPVTDEDVEANLDQRIRTNIRQLGSQELLEQYAGKTIYQLKDDARETVKENMLAEEMQKKIVNSVRITPTEVKTFFDKIPKDSLPYFESQLEVGQIIVYPKASRDLEEYIIGEINGYKRQIESKVATFDQLARRYSEDPGSRDRGGSYQINRNEKDWDPAFLSAAFRLRDGQISAPVKSEKFGYFLIQMVERRGDDADVRMILRVPPVTDAEINAGKSKLDSVRSRVIAGTMSFNEAASKFSDDEAVKYSGAFLQAADGSTYVTIDQMDKEMVTTLSKMNVGEISQPIAYTSEQGKKGVRIIYLKSRSQPHRMNMQDDYSKISQLALEEKKAIALDKWIRAMIPTYYIMVDKNAADDCPELNKFSVASEKGF